MKVYTHFFKINETEGFRWRTLLHFGNSWDCIGSIVMKNPGSSTFTKEAPVSKPEVLEGLSRYRFKELNWYEFSIDPTMRYVASLFAYKYGLDDPAQLSGVIQIFNLFYIKDADLTKAKQKAEKYGIPPLFNNALQMTQYDIDHLIAPVYLGFGSLAYSKEYGERAKLIFDAAIKLEGCNYLSCKFCENFYYHPQWLIPFGKNYHNGLLTLLRFKQETFYPTDTNNAISNIPRNAISPSRVKNIESAVLENFPTCRYDNNRRVRSNENAAYGITIAEGYIEVRQAFEGKSKTAQPKVSDSKVKKTLEDRGYISEKNWLGRKRLIDFGNTDSEIIEYVCTEIQELFKELEIYH